MGMTRCQINHTFLFQHVLKIMTACRMLQISIACSQIEPEIHSLWAYYMHVQDNFQAQMMLLLRWPLGRICYYYMMLLQNRLRVCSGRFPGICYDGPWKLIKISIMGIRYTISRHKRCFCHDGPWEGYAIII